VNLRADADEIGQIARAPLHLAVVAFDARLADRYPTRPAVAIWASVVMVLVNSRLDPLAVLAIGV
jgi:hypothetical protein